MWNAPNCLCLINTMYFKMDLFLIPLLHQVELWAIIRFKFSQRWLLFKGWCWCHHNITSALFWDISPCHVDRSEPPNDPLAGCPKVEGLHCSLSFTLKKDYSWWTLDINTDLDFKTMHIVIITGFSRKRISVLAWGPPTFGLFIKACTCEFLSQKYLLTLQSISVGAHRAPA